MKTASVLFLSFVALATIVSCNKDDNKDSAAATTSMEGKWELYQEGETLATIQPVENEGSCGLTTMEFLKTGNYQENGFDYYNSSCHSYTEAGTWSKTGNSLTVKDSDNETTVLEVIELTETSLKIKETDADGTWINVFRKK